MPRDEQLLDMARSKITRNGPEDLFGFEIPTGEERVVARQFLELAFLLSDRIPASVRRTAAMVQLARARDNAIEALRSRTLR